MAETAQEVRKHVKIYIFVFMALAFLTIVTVLVSYLKLAILPAVIVALFIASIKASLVALFFMHLIDEKKLIYAALIVTAVFLLALLFLPLTGLWDSTGV
jgi:cytochrome c oxidase subunit 4